MSKSKTVAVIGGGIGGLAVANILAKAGYKVTVYEAHQQLGGRAGLLKAKGFTFDTGPSWYLMPEVFEHYFSLLDDDVSKRLDLVRLDPAYKVFFQTRQPVEISSDVKQAKQLFEELEPGAADKLTRYLVRSTQTYQLAQKYFLYNPFTNLRKAMTPEVLRQLPKFMQLTTKPLHSYVKKFFTNQETQQILEYPTVFLGASPYSAPAIFSLMSYLDLEQGVFYPKGGMYKIVEALHSVGQDLGVQYKLSSPVTAITVENGQATGLQMKNSDRVAADLVISNADLHFTETVLLPREHQTYPEAYWQKRQAGPSALLMYLGVKGELPALNHHNLFFIKDWRGNFNDIFKAKQWSVPASMYVCKPSATDSTVAPKGSQNVFVLVPAPAKQISQSELERLADAYLDQLAQTAGISDLKQRITYKKIYGPDDFSNDFHAWQGTALGPAHTLRQSALFRPANRSKKVKNLYYVGAGTQPGIGVPMCLISAELVYKHITGDDSPGPLKAIEGLV